MVSVVLPAAWRMSSDFTGPTPAAVQTFTTVVVVKLPTFETSVMFTRVAW